MRGRTDFGFDCVDLVGPASRIYDHMATIVFVYGQKAFGAFLDHDQA